MNKTNGIKRMELNKVRKKILDYILILFAIGMAIYFSFASQYFLSVANFMNILSSVSVVGIISTGMTLVIITKGIEGTIDNVGRLGKDGMKETNEEIIRIMIND